MHILSIHKKSIPLLSPTFTVESITATQDNRRKEGRGAPQRIPWYTTEHANGLAFDPSDNLDADRCHSSTTTLYTTTALPLEHGMSKVA